MENLNTLEDFLENPFFVQWLRSPDADSNAFWAEWLRENPSRKQLFETAVATFLALEGHNPVLPDEAVRVRVERLKERMTEAGPQEPVVWWRNAWLGRAAVIALVLGVAWFFIAERNNRQVPGHDAPAAREKAVAESPEVIENGGTQDLLVNLPDGSSVLLSAGSRLELKENSEGFTREVTLTGEGFFEIAKRKGRPFYVHTTALTTKVLGTSFLVRSFEKEARALVRVRTGKVEVTSNGGTISRAGGGRPATVLLEPSEQAYVLRQEEKLVKEPAAGDSEKEGLFELQHFEFRFAPVEDVFELLEKTYGTRIMYDREKFRNCTLTANLTDAPFLDKIKLICAGMDAEYTVSEKGIAIRGSGCN